MLETRCKRGADLRKTTRQLVERGYITVRVHLSVISPLRSSLFIPHAYFRLHTTALAPMRGYFNTAARHRPWVVAPRTPFAASRGLRSDSARPPLAAPHYCGSTFGYLYASLLLIFPLTCCLFMMFPHPSTPVHTLSLRFVFAPIRHISAPRRFGPLWHRHWHRHLLISAFALLAPDPFPALYIPSAARVRTLDLFWSILPPVMLHSSSPPS